MKNQTTQKVTSLFAFITLLAVQVAPAGFAAPAPITAASKNPEAEIAVAAAKTAGTTEKVAAPTSTNFLMETGGISSAAKATVVAPSVQQVATSKAAATVAPEVQRYMDQAQKLGYTASVTFVPATTPPQVKVKFTDTKAAVLGAVKTVEMNLSVDAKGVVQVNTTAAITVTCYASGSQTIQPTGKQLYQALQKMTADPATALLNVLVTKATSVQQNITISVDGYQYDLKGTVITAVTPPAVTTYVTQLQKAMPTFNVAKSWVLGTYPPQYLVTVTNKTSSGQTQRLRQMSFKLDGKAQLDTASMKADYYNTIPNKVVNASLLFDKLKGLALDNGVPVEQQALAKMSQLKLTLSSADPIWFELGNPAHLETYIITNIAGSMCLKLHEVEEKNTAGVLVHSISYSYDYRGKGEMTILVDETFDSSGKPLVRAQTNYVPTVHGNSVTTYYPGTGKVKSTRTHMVAVNVLNVTVVTNAFWELNLAGKIIHEVSYNDSDLPVSENFYSDAGQLTDRNEYTYTDTGFSITHQNSTGVVLSTIQGQGTLGAAGQATITRPNGMTKTVQYASLGKLLELARQFEKEQPPVTTINMSAGLVAVQAAINAAPAGSTFTVTGSGTLTGTSLTIKAGITVTFSATVGLAINQFTIDGTLDHAQFVHLEETNSSFGGSGAITNSYIVTPSGYPIPFEIDL